MRKAAKKGNSAEKYDKQEKNNSQFKPVFESLKLMHLKSLSLRAASQICLLAMERHVLRFLANS